jgi:hypothetical protein
MVALSDSVEDEFSPRVADAQTGSANITRARLDSKAPLRRCDLQAGVSTCRNIGLPCMI